MSRLDRTFADYRRRAMAQPVTRASQKILPTLELPGGVSVGLSVNL